jgi:hypothetical protein
MSEDFQRGYAQFRQMAGEENMETFSAQLRAKEG